LPNTDEIIAEQNREEPNRDKKRSHKRAGLHARNKAHRFSSMVLIMYLLVCGIALVFVVNNAIHSGNNTELLSVFFIAVLNISLILVFELLAIRKIQIPLTKLKYAADQLLMGNYDTRQELEISGDDEIAHLVEAFNQIRCVMRESSESKEKYIKDIQGRVDELNFVTELNDTILRFDNPDHLFDLITDKVCQLLGGTKCCLVLRSKEDLINVRSLHGFSSEEKVAVIKTIREGEYTYDVCPAMASDKLVHIDDVKNADANEQAKNIFSKIEASSMMAAPLRVDGHIIGSMTVWYRNKQEFPESLLNRFKMFVDQTAVLIQSAKLVRDMKYMSLDVVRAFANTIDARDSYTANHSDRVSRFSVAIAQEIGLSAHEVEIIEYAGLLHDLGKIGIKEDILNKPGALTVSEKEAMDQHVVMSAKIIEPIEFLKDAVPIILHHHEWYNGRGYPSGLAGEQVPLGARILAVADAFEAMTSNRVYSQEISQNEAVKRLLAGSGAQFDPVMVQAMINVVSKIAVVEAIDKSNMRNSSVTGNVCSLKADEDNDESLDLDSAV
jgi:putative nucleotidyltransferase with HDIG domain